MHILVNEYICFIGVDAIPIGGNGDVNRFTYTDGTTDNLKFIRSGRGLPPWHPGEPNNDKNKGENCVQYAKNFI